MPDSKDHDAIILLTATVNSLDKNVQEIKADMKSSLTEIKDLINKSTKDHGDRISTLETWKNLMAGAGTVISTAISAMLGHHMSKH